MQVLGTLGGNSAWPVGITDDELIAGSSTLTGDQFRRGFVWTPAGGMQNIGLMPGSSTDATARIDVNGVSSNGILTGSGYVMVDGSAREHAFRWTQTAGFEDLGPGVGYSSRGMSVNSAGEVAGYVFGAPGGHRWARWRPESVAPVPGHNGPYAAAEGSTLTFDARSSSGRIAAYHWDFGDGTTSSLALAEHAYADNGSYPVRLTLTSTDGLASEAITGATISNVAPTVTAGGNGAVVTGGTFARTIAFAAAAASGRAASSSSMPIRYSRCCGTPAAAGAKGMSCTSSRPSTIASRTWASTTGHGGGAWIGATARCSRAR